MFFQSFTQERRLVDMPSRNNRHSRALRTLSRPLGVCLHYQAVGARLRATALAYWTGQWG
jgi:hypothetical protein